MKTIFYLIYFASIIGIGMLFSHIGYRSNTWQWWVGTACVVGAYISGIGITANGGFTK